MANTNGVKSPGQIEWNVGYETGYADGKARYGCALADLVAAAEPAVNTMAILLNAIGGQSGSPADVDRTKLYDAIERARKVMKEEK